MTAERRWWVLIWLIIFAACNTGSSVTALVWAPATDSNLVLNIQPRYFQLQLAPAEQTIINIKITNWSTTSWRTGEFYLQTILPSQDNLAIAPVIPQPLWSGEATTLSYKTAWTQIGFGQSFDFRLPLTAPDDALAGSGRYRLYLQPVVAGQALSDLIIVDLKVGHPPTSWSVLPEKRIEVSLADQTATLFAGPLAVAKLTISSGKTNTETPPGRYVINKKLVDVLSDAINLQLPYWMELRDLNGTYEGYGLHGVPYQQVNSAYYQEGKTYDGYKYYSDGKLYTGYNLLGTPMSQGCVVMSIKNAQAVFSWAEPNKTLVNIQ
ncbi:MAG: L,D-transpeptidase [Patescibacteria group bacterium]|jgi:lipoprotein-anchoring transpeptidase ErfK/SrfK